MIRIALWVGVFLYVIVGRKYQEAGKGGVATAAMERTGFRDYIAGVFGARRAPEDGAPADAATAEDAPAEDAAADAPPPPADEDEFAPS